MLRGGPSCDKHHLSGSPLWTPLSSIGDHVLQINADRREFNRLTSQMYSPGQRTTTELSLSADAISHIMRQYITSDYPYMPLRSRISVTFRSCHERLRLTTTPRRLSLLRTILYHNYSSISHVHTSPTSPHAYCTASRIRLCFVKLSDRALKAHIPSPRVRYRILPEASSTSSFDHP